MIDRTLEVINQITTDQTVKSIINSINHNQTRSKLWLIQKSKPFVEMISEPSVCIAAGWYGHLAKFFRQMTYGKIVSYDMDPMCKTIGEKLQKGQNINFITEQMQSFDPYDFNINICTSCEHIKQEDLNNYISKMNRNSLKILQSNNYIQVEEHINCKENLEDFVSEFKIGKLLFKGTLKLDKYDRYMVIFI